MNTPEKEAVFSENIKTAESLSNYGRRYYAFLQMKHMKRPRMAVSSVSLDDAIKQAQQAEERERTRKSIRSQEMARRRKERSEKAIQAAKTVKAGDIFYCSWGYDQTNIDFYEVVSVSGLTAEIRAINSSETEDGFMCGKSSPVPHSFSGEPMKKRIQSYSGEPYFSGTCGHSISPYDGKPLYCSHYA